MNNPLRFWAKSTMYFSATVGTGYFLLQTLVPGEAGQRAALAEQGRLVHAPSASESQQTASRIMEMYDIRLVLDWQ